MDIKGNKIDLSVAISKGVFGAIPIVGSLISELIGYIIPNQRIERISTLIEKMEAKLENVDKETIKKIFTTPQYIDLLEDGFLQASRALSLDRIEHIAHILAKALTDDEIKYSKSKVFLILLGQVTDLEIILLGSQYYTWREYPEYHERHKDILKHITPTLASDENELEEFYLYDNYKQHLAQLGLLKQNYKSKVNFNHALTELEVNMEPYGYSLTKLGEYFIKFLKITP